MCRGKACVSGGRRCPGDTPEKRRARQNAAYRAKKAAQENPGGDGHGDTGTDDPDTSPGSTAGSGDTSSQSSDATDQPHSTSEWVSQTRDLMAHYRDSDTPMVAKNDQGWMVATEDGLRAEKALQDTGKALSTDAHKLAAERMGDIGQDRAVRRHTGDVNVSTRDEYLDQLKNRRHDLSCKIRSDSKELVQMMADKNADPQEYKRRVEANNAMRKQANGVIIELNRAKEGDTAWDRAEARVYSAAYRDVIAQHRDLGPSGPLSSTMDIHPTSQKAPLKRLEKALAYYPTDWIDADKHHTEQLAYSLKPVPMRVRSTSKRGYYAPAEYTTRLGLHSSLIIDKRDEGCLGPGMATTLHEYGHRAERVTPQINQLAQAHLARRTTHSDGTRHDLEAYLVTKKQKRNGPPATGQDRLRDGEWVRSNKFASRYTGKEYGTDAGNTEVFTTGVEAIFTGVNGGTRGTGNHRTDPEHRNFILGLLATVTAPRQE